MSPTSTPTPTPTYISGGYIDPNLSNPHGPNDASIIIYGYTPSAPLAILGATLFGILFVSGSIQVVRFRLWSYTPILVGCLLEVIGYSFRYMSAHVDPYRILFFILQYFCITVAPVFVAASVYVYLSKLAGAASVQKFRTGWAVGRLGPRAILAVFITADAVCTVLQITGAALIGAKTSKNQDPTTANDILIGGLAAQSLAILVFLVLLVDLVTAICRSHQSIPTHMKRCMLALCLAGGLIALRTVFRLCESAQGVFGYLSSHEAFFGALEFAPVVVAVATLTICTPASLTAAAAAAHDKQHKYTSSVFQVAAHPKSNEGNFSD